MSETAISLSKKHPHQKFSSPTTIHYPFSPPSSPIYTHTQKPSVCSSILCAGEMASTSTPIALFLLFSVAATIASTLAQDTNMSSWSPMSSTTPELNPFYLGEASRRRRRLVGRFQVCALCTCCGGPRGMCLPAPCCYAINCNIPNRPFGFCAFTPRTCNCFNCHL